MFTRISHDVENIILSYCSMHSHVSLSFVNRYWQEHTRKRVFAALSPHFDEVVGFCKMLVHYGAFASHLFVFNALVLGPLRSLKVISNFTAPFIKFLEAQGFVLLYSTSVQEPDSWGYYGYFTQLSSPGYVYRKNNLVVHLFHIFGNCGSALATALEGHCIFDGAHVRIAKNERRTLQ
jgi:hypothetical protein